MEYSIKFASQNKEYNFRFSLVDIVLVEPKRSMEGASSTNNVS